MSNGGVPLGQVSPEVKSAFDNFLAQNPEQVALAPADPNKVADATQRSAEEQKAAEDRVAEEVRRKPAEEDLSAAADETDETPEEVVADAEPDGEEQLEVESEEEVPPVETVSELAGLFEDAEVTEESLLDLTVEGRGEGERISLREALSFYRSGPTEDQHFTTRLAAARGELESAHDLALEETSQVTQGLIAATQAEFEGVDWAALETQDPGEYIRLSKRRDLLNDRINAAIQHMKGEMTKREQTAEQRSETFVAEQVHDLHKLHPAWKDPEVGRAAMEEVQSLVISAGFSQDEIRDIQDARTIHIIWKAAQYDKLKASQPGLKNRLRVVPKMSRATARAAETAPREQQQKRHAALSQAHSEAGTVDTAAALFRENMR